MGPHRNFKLDLLRLDARQLAAWAGETSIGYRDDSVATCELRYVAPADLAQLMMAQETARRALPNPDLFRPVSEDRHHALLQGHGCSAGAFVNGRLIAYASAQFPVPLDENQGRAIGIADDRLDSVCQMEGIVVDPAFRGHHLARLLNEMRLCRALQSGYSIAVATISPFNAQSLASFVPTGFLVKGLREGPGSLLRYYVSDDMTHDAVPINDDIVTVPTGDLQRQKDLLSEGWWGFRPVNAAAGLAMQYGRFRLRGRPTFHDREAVVAQQAKRLPSPVLAA